MNPLLPVPELLSPAGDPDCAIAAIQNGADAVYLGLTYGSARANAGNFTWTQLREILEYAHLRGSGVYLAFNTLFFDSEMGKAFETAMQAAAEGVDALILQDLGLADRLLREKSLGRFPGKAELHASTQMSLGTPEGARFLKEAGFDRLIAARELSLEELRALVAEGLPIECFIHGALCMSVSGQCLLSSYIGGRSGNRGSCAQPCRLRYQLAGKEGHLLSPSDFCALPYLDQLAATGVASLKIEGRLKSPEYVALTTSKYRKALDALRTGTFDAYREGPELAEDLRELTLSFSRGRFTSGYLFGKIPVSDITVQNPGRKGLRIGVCLPGVRKLPRPNGLPPQLCLAELTVKTTETLCPGDGVTVSDDRENALFGGTVNKAEPRPDGLRLTVVGEKRDLEKFSSFEKECGLYLTHRVSLSERVHKTYENGVEHKKVPLHGIFTARVGSPAELCLSDPENRSVTVRTDTPVAPAASAPLQNAQIQKQLGKMQNTPFELTVLSIETEGSVFLPVSGLNALRRDALEALTALRIQKPEPPMLRCGGSGFPAVSVPNGKQPEIPKNAHTLYFYRLRDFLASDSEKLRCNAPYAVYLPFQAWLSDADRAALLQKKGACSVRVIASFPFLPLGRERTLLEEALPLIRETADGIQITNPADFDRLPELAEQDNFLLCADFSLNVTNSDAARFCRDRGIRLCTVSPEAVRDGAVPENVPDGMIFEQIVSGPVPLMRTRHCLIRTGNAHCGRCTREKSQEFILTDSHGAAYPILTETGDCQNILLSPDAFSAPAAIDAVRRINLTKEF